MQTINKHSKAIKKERLNWQCRRKKNAQDETNQKQ